MKNQPNFFDKAGAERYDEKNSKLSPISDCLHFLTSLVLRDLPEQSRVLCVGVGTGTEILAFARKFPQWTFVGLDPSGEMLDVCRQRVKEAGIANRCEFVHGYVQDLPNHKDFDIAMSILVAHFVKRDERLSFYENITRRLRKGGYLINAEISFDLESPEFPAMLKSWEGVQTLMGATPESLAALPKTLREVLTVLPSQETEKLLKQSGIVTPLRFYQALMISAWYGKV